MQRPVIDIGLALAEDTVLSPMIEVNKDGDANARAVLVQLAPSRLKLPVADEPLNGYHFGAIDPNSSIVYHLAVRATAAGGNATLADRGFEEMNRSQRILASASVAGLAFLFLLALVISYQFQTAGHYSDQAERSRGILIAVQNLNRGLMKAESGQRGFLLTSKASYLDSYLKGVTASQAALADIARQLKDNNAEQEQQAILRDLVQAKLHELSETVELEKAHRHSEAIAIVQSDRGQDLMDRIQQFNGNLLDNERVRLGEHSTAIKAGRLLTGRLFRAGLIGMAVLCTTTIFLIWRSLAAQRIAIQALRLNEAKLAEKEHLLRTITDNLPVLIAYVDSNEVVRFSNLTYKTWFNRDPAQALGRPLAEVMGPDM